MKALCVAACVALMRLPVSATTAQKHNKTHHKVTPSSSAAHRTTTAVKHTAATSSRPEAKTHAGLQNAKYSTATTSTTTSTTSSTSKSTTKHASSKKKSSKSKHVKREPTQMAPSSDRISEIQTALGRGGYYTTDNSVREMGCGYGGRGAEIQSANGLDATGKLDALTLQKLGLGSDVGGRFGAEGHRAA